MTALPPTLQAAALRLGLEAVDLAEDGAAARLQAALEDATELTLAEVHPVTAALWRDTAPAAVHIVVLAVARRAYENPRGIRSETLGEHTVGLTDTSGVYLTGRERSIATRAAWAPGHRPAFVGSLRTRSAYAA